MLGQHTRNSVRMGMFTPDQRAEYKALRGDALRALGKTETGLPPEVSDNLDDMLILAVESGRTDLIVDARAWQAEIDKQREQEAYDRRRADEAARRRLAAENNPPSPPPTSITLEDLLAQPEDSATYRVDGCLPIGACMMLVARAKSGKTRIITSLVRALVDGTLFLGKYRVEPVEFGVTIFDNEMDPRMIRAWYKEANIENTHLVHIVPLRGRTTAFDILDPKKRFELVKLYEGSEVYILDALRPALDSFGLDENREAGRYVQAWKNFVYELQGEESIIVHHMGHSGERARGDSGLIGGVDGTWKIVLQDPEDAANKDADPAEATRFFSAYGRDVSVPEQQLGGPPSRMEIVGGNRRTANRQHKVAALTEPVLELVKANGGCGVTDLERLLRQQSTAFQKGDVSAVLKALARTGQISVWSDGPGPGRKRHHYWNDPVRPSFTPAGLYDLTPEISRPDEM